jgi:hypothetical protein
MTRPLPPRRLTNQKLGRSTLTTAAGVVGWMGAVQAQEYLPAQWAIGLRAPTLTAGDVEAAFARGEILRTHVLRPTWHFVTPRDIRWMLALTGPRVAARMAPYNRRLELDRRLFTRTHRAIARALEGGRALTRKELADVLARAGIKARKQRLAHIMMQAELDGIVCSGPRRDGQFTYALLSDRASSGPALEEDEALAELARRFCQSHGPATVRDFAWWSGLSMKDARRGVEAVSPPMRSETIDGLTMWSVEDTTPLRRGRSAHLLPIYDEYLNAYRDRAPIIDARVRASSARDDFGHYLVVDGRYVGTWRWLPGEGAITVRVMPYVSLTAADLRLVEQAARRLGSFAGARVSVVRAK